MMNQVIGVIVKEVLVMFIQPVTQAFDQTPTCSYSNGVFDIINCFSLKNICNTCYQGRIPGGDRIRSGGGQMNFRALRARFVPPLSNFRGGTVPPLSPP